MYWFPKPCVGIELQLEDPPKKMENYRQVETSSKILAATRQHLHMEEREHETVWDVFLRGQYFWGLHRADYGSLKPKKLFHVAISSRAVTSI